MFTPESFSHIQKTLRSAQELVSRVHKQKDLFSNTDKGYTNGTKLSWFSHDLTEYEESGRLPKWSLPYVRKIPFINKPGRQRNVTLSRGEGSEVWNALGITVIGGLMVSGIVTLILVPIVYSLVHRSKTV